MSRILPPKALIVLDMTVEQMNPVSYRRKEIVEVIAKLARKFVIKIDSRLWITDPKSTSLWRVYSGMGQADTKAAQIIPELRQCELHFIRKLNYSAFCDSTLEAYLRKNGITDIYLAGINTDIGVFATALDCFQKKYRTYILEDGTSTVCGRSAHLEGIRRLSMLFGNDSVISSTEI